MLSAIVGLISYVSLTKTPVSSVRVEKGSCISVFHTTLLYAQHLGLFPFFLSVRLMLCYVPGCDFTPTRTIARKFPAVQIVQRIGATALLLKAS